MPDFLPRSLRCPICNTTFVVEVPLRAEPVRSETDFRPVYDGPDPIAADLHACPSCNYAGFAPAFEREAEGGEEEEEVERPGLPEPIRPLGFLDETDLDDLRRWIRRGNLTEGLALDGSAAERYRLAARIREYLDDQDPLPVADLLLRGAWCARAVGDAATERRLLREAGDRFAMALEAGKLGAREKGRFVYLAAEVARRAGDFGRAVDLFGQVDSFVDLEEEEGLELHRLTRRQEALASVQSAVNAVIPSAEELESIAGPEAWDEEEEDEDEE